MDRDSQPLSNEDQEDIIIKRAFEDSVGAAALIVLKRNFYNRPDYNPEELQPYHTFFRSGQRDVVGFIEECIERATHYESSVAVKKNL